MLHVFVLIIVYIEIHFAIKFIEYFYCICIMHQPPNVDSSVKMRQKVADQINEYYKDAKKICDIGSGFGGMTRFVARKTNKKIIGFENMLVSAMLSKFFDIFCFGKTKTIWCNAYDYLDVTKEVFDVAIAYLGPKQTEDLLKYKQKIRVLICLDFNIEQEKPVRIIDLGHGYTKYNNKKYPHRLFVYEFK